MHTNRRASLASWPAFRVSCNSHVHVRAITQSRTPSQPRAPLEGDDLQDSLGRPSLDPRASLSFSREKLLPYVRSRVWVSMFFWGTFFFKVRGKLCIQLKSAQNCMRVCIRWKQCRFSRPGWLSESEIRRRSLGVTSSMRCEKRIGHEPRSLSDAGKRSTCFAEINGCRVAAYEYVSIRLAVFRRSVNRICSRAAAISTGGSAEMYRILGAREN